MSARLLLLAAAVIVGGRLASEPHRSDQGQPWPWLSGAGGGVGSSCDRRRCRRPWTSCCQVGAELLQAPTRSDAAGRRLSERAAAA
jgi:hypothetical protein